MEKTIKRQRKIIIILSILVFLGIPYTLLAIDYNNKIIEEMDRGAKIDYQYINKIAEVDKSTYSIWQTCNNLLVKDLKGTLTDKELTTSVVDYTKQAETMMKLETEIEDLKNKRHEEFSKFKYATVYKYKPE